LLTPDFHQLHAIDMSALATEACAGLQEQQARVSPKFLYDPLGSRLFDAITELDEYYPTRTEAAIVAAHGDDIARHVRHSLPGAYTMVDLGAGDCVKAARLLGALQPARYVAVDISAAHLQQALQRLQHAHPDLPMQGIGLDFSADLRLPDSVPQGPSLVFYPGSSIGNFDPAEALRLLRDMRALSHDGALLIGVDLIKDAAVLEAAYDDALGVTAAFNLNLLRHLNGLIGSDFAPRQWQHRARYDRARDCIEMHLVARTDLQVRWPGGSRRFAAGEHIHTENSYKWTLDGFAALLRDGGWRDVKDWTDPGGAFAVLLAR
jgi:L-histidine Nalpha-methyltransferase